MGEDDNIISENIGTIGGSLLKRAICGIGRASNGTSKLLGWLIPRTEGIERPFP